MEQYVEFPKLGIELAFKNSFTIGTFTIAYYGIIIAFGLMLGLIYALTNLKKVGVDSDKAIDAIIGGIIGGILGARLYFVALTYENYKISFESASEFWRTFSNIFKTWEGGMAIYGGLIGSLIVGLLIAKWRKVKMRPLLDVIGVGFLIGQGIGRWGNFFNVEAFGSNTNLPWGMTGPAVTSYLQSNMEALSKLGVTVDPTMPVHPCFLYESIWCLIGAVLLHLYMQHRKFDGEVFLMYIAYYGFGRFFIEGLRTDSLTLGSLRVSQLLAGLLVVASIIAIVVIRNNIKSNNDKEYMRLFVTTPEGFAIATGVPFVAEATDNGLVGTQSVTESAVGSEKPTVFAITTLEMDFTKFETGDTVTFNGKTYEAIAAGETVDTSKNQFELGDTADANFISAVESSGFSAGKMTYADGKMTITSTDATQRCSKIHWNRRSETIDSGVTNEAAILTDEPKKEDNNGTDN